MPSVKEGSELTGLSRRKVAVEEVFRSDSGPLESLDGTLNWKNSYSASRVSESRTSSGKTHLPPLRSAPLHAISPTPSSEDLLGRPRPVCQNLGRRS
jgi:hypothetical protein